MKAAVYCRVSTETQELEGTSLQTQLEACLAKAKELGYEVPKDNIVLESYSGITLDRPKLFELREWVRNKQIDAVIAYTYDRLSRDPVDFIILQDEIDKHGLQLILVAETLDTTDEGKLIMHIKGYAAKLEHRKITDRTTRGRRARLRTGKLANGRASYQYGYDYIPGRGEGQGIRQINEKQAEVVRNIFRWYISEHLPIDQIVYRLRELGIPSPTGNSLWAPATINKMLNNPSYYGANSQTTPAVIDESTYRDAQAKLKHNKDMASRNLKREYLLRGYLYCQYCGRRYQGATKKYQTKQGTKEYRYYRCSSSYKVSTAGCHNHAWKADELETLVRDAIFERLSKPDAILQGINALKEEANSLNDYTEELKAIENRLAELDREQQNLLSLALKGFPDSLVVTENKIINESRANLTQRKTDIEERIASARQAEINTEKATMAIELAKRRLNDDDFSLALEMLDIHITIGENAVNIEGIIPVFDGVVVPTPLKQNGERMPSISACQLTQLEQRIPLGWGLPHLGQIGGITLDSKLRQE